MYRVGTSAMAEKMRLGLDEQGEQAANGARLPLAHLAERQPLGGAMRLDETR
jgi:hypothetical protein